MSAIKRIVQRFKLSGNLIRMPERPKVPTLFIGGRKYVLSDYWPMSEGLSEGMAPQGGGARLIDLGGNRFRYLWVYDTDRKYLVMWRHSDGDEKVYERASNLSHYLYTLEKKHQLNRVTHEEFLEVERFMNRRYKEMVEQLEKQIEETATDWDRQVAEILKVWFDQSIRPKIDQQLSDLERGAIPLGFKVNDRILQYRSPKEQVTQYVVTRALSAFNESDAYKAVSKAVGFDAYEPPQGDPQAVQWAWHALLEKVYKEYLPFTA